MADSTAGGKNIDLFVLRSLDKDYLGLTYKAISYLKFIIVAIKIIIFYFPHVELTTLAWEPL